MRHSPSIAGKISLLVAGLLIGVAALFGAFAHRFATHSAMGATVDRLRSVANQLGQPTGASLAKRLVAMQQLADTPAVVRTAMGNARPAQLTHTRTLLASFGTDTNEVVDVAIRDQHGRAVLRLRPPATSDGPESASPQGADTIAVSPMFRSGPDVVYEVSAPIHGGGRVIGHLIQRRRVTATPEALAQLTALVGFESTFLIGNSDGSLWSDFRQVVERPPRLTSGGIEERYQVDGQEVVRVAVRVGGSPLLIGVETPTSVVAAQAQTLLRPLYLSGMVIVLLGSVAGWMLGGRLTRPLVRLTTAAEAIASGSPQQVPELRQDDEIGRLGDAIRTMAERLRGEQSRLEAQVEERTAALSEAMDRLRATQEELVRKERFAILGHLSSGVGHELRNPLGVMTNAVYYLTASLPDAPAKVQEYFGVLRDQIRLCEKIIADLLDFARVKPPERETIPLASILEAQLVRTTIPPTIRVERDINAKLPPVDVDPVQIGQVVLNLIINAVQAMGNVPGVLRCHAQAQDGTVTLSVIDTGPGIPREHLESVFEPLFTTKARGIGLGLSVSRALALNNDAVLTAANVPGGGARFDLVLPAKREAP